MRKIMALIGVPASGKSTIMGTFMSTNSDRTIAAFGGWEPFKEGLVEGHHHKELDIFVIGRYGEGHKFPGADRLSMAVQPEAKIFLENHPTSHILFEGDRLGTASFLEFCAEQTGEDDEFHILIITTKPTIIEARHVDRADTQSEIFKRGRETKIDNIRSNFMLMDHVVNFEHNTPQDTDAIVQYLNQQLL